MNSAEKVYQTLQTFPQPLIEEVLQFVEFLQFKQEQLAHLPNETTLKAIQAAEKGEYEAVSLDDLKQQWSDA